MNNNLGEIIAETSRDDPLNIELMNIINLSQRLNEPISNILLMPASRYKIISEIIIELDRSESNTKSLLDDMKKGKTVWA
jgi:hypothetical protein